MSCGRLKDISKNKKDKEEIRQMAIKYQKKTKKVIVFFHCSDYDFTELENFNPDGKKEIEYFM